MATASKSFTAVGAGTELRVRRGESFDYSVSGSFVGTVKLQRHVRGDLWEDTGVSATTSASGTLKAVTGAFDETKYRWLCSAYTSGTIVTSLTDTVETVKTYKDYKGNDKFRFKENGILESVGDHFKINSFVSGEDHAGKTVRLNVLTSIGVADSLIGFQSKPGMGATTTKEVIGGEISPRINDTFGGSTIKGLHTDVYLKGTTGNLSGDVRAHEVELVTDDAGARTITGNVNYFRLRAAFSGTISGKFIPFRVEKAEAQTGSNNYDALFDLTGQSPDCWNDDPTTELNLPGGTVKGYIKARVNGADRYIALYEKGNLAD